MSAIEFKNAKGQIRYQPAHPDGRRLYAAGWDLPEDARGIESNPPSLYRLKKRAYRRVSWLIAAENQRARQAFKEVR